MSPSAIEPFAQAPLPQDAIPPPHLYTPREAHFDRFVEPRSDGYQKAVSQGPDRAAIVIDNGTPFIWEL
jgi:actin-related protein 5